MKDLLFLPLDITLPELAFPELVNPDSNIPGVSFWTYEQLLDLKSKEAFPWKTDLDSTRITYKNIISQLPFDSLENVRLSIQSKKVKPHVDVNDDIKINYPESYNHYLKNEPCGYRIVISGNKSAIKLIVNSKIVTAELPYVPCIYLLNSTKCYHYIDGDIGRKTIYIRGKVNTLEHKNIIEKSLEKFKDYAVFSNS